MNSIYIKYTYIALYLGRALSLFSLSHFKNEVLLPLSVVQPSSSQLAKLCLQVKERKIVGWAGDRKWTCCPSVRGVPVHLPLSQRLRVEKTACFGCGFWFCCSGFGFWAGGGGFVPITLVLYVLFCCSSILYQCQEGGVKSFFCTPK